MRLLRGAVELATSGQKGKRPVDPRLKAVSEWPIHQASDYGKP